MFLDGRDARFESQALRGSLAMAVFPIIRCLFGLRIPRDEMRKRCHDASWNTTIEKLDVLLDTAELYA